ncbi:hypothetical protein SAMN05443574_103214 [Haloarcula vallismortis]|uniref:Uncharacterized protein n=2 Tax=Haloarcula vallismortis TaxID=28442 RepID=M0JRD7_HALVA|nr:hypothetical protein [Haloarcula vallismortis]EMA11511.1 hypothetical protein C437_01325 [Haloarcula vallismortis ATCC 29715]SDW43374.1 hypothetical protein SAMN05443574_103214 [Haloarcula vallismortis]
MDQLSSCYFCAGALDVSLSEYPIIPKSLDPEAEKQGTVVLCSTCREKLATIVEPAVKAAKADARDAAKAATDTGTAGPTGLSDDAKTTTSADPTATDSVVEPADDGSLLGDDSATADDQKRSVQSAETAAAAPEQDVAKPANSTAESDATGTAEADTPDERTADPTETNDTGAAAAETESGDTDSSDTSDTSDSSADGPSLTKLEYNKVMRLLQNREMPVDRTEIREVAVNAYDIDGEQFDAIIDAAVDRDLIGQENGQLVESDG